LFAEPLLATGDAGGLDELQLIKNPKAVHDAKRYGLLIMLSMLAPRRSWGEGEWALPTEFVLSRQTSGLNPRAAHASD
jgi:hypothetical protein